MRFRKTSGQKATKLSIKKETLRDLQPRALRDDQLRAVHGGYWGGPAPSQLTC